MKDVPLRSVFRGPENDISSFPSCFRRRRNRIVLLPVCPPRNECVHLRVFSASLFRPPSLVCISPLALRLLHSSSSPFHFHFPFWLLLLFLLLSLSLLVFLCGCSCCCCCCLFFFYVVCLTCIHVAGCGSCAREDRLQARMVDGIQPERRTLDCAELSGAVPIFACRTGT
jgi:hypothetical protein